MMKKYKIYIVPHTHWDREWYLSYQGFRMKLVELIDELLELMEKDKNYRYFILDGQAVVLRDYLEIRPENEKRLQKLIKEGRVMVGPFYILPDEFLVSGEATIRNLLLGFKIAKEFGKVMKVGYLPDPFGHISQMPQILKGFCIDNFFFMRGYDGGKSGKSEFWWESPDGSRVFAIWMPQGYCNAVKIPVEEEDAERYITDIKEKLVPYAVTRNLLAMNGCDHEKAQYHLSDLIRNMNGRLKDVELLHSTLENYVRAVKLSKPRLDVVRGEMRVQKAIHGGQWLLSGILSSRVYLKQRNQTAQDTLERWAEPYSAIAWLLGSGYPKAFIWKSWEYLLQNHPHDSICGCSIDQVHRDMMARFDASLDISTRVTRNALGYIGTKVGLSEEGILVFNPLPWEREDLVSADLSFDPQKKVGKFKILSEKGEEIPYVITGRFECDREDNWRVADGYRLMFLSRIPAFGYSFYKVQTGTPVLTQGKSLITADGVMENEYLKVRIQPDGSLEIFDKENNQNYSGLNTFEDGGDTGDEYNYSYPEKDKVIKSSQGQAEIKLLFDTSDFACYQIRIKLNIPCGLTSNRSVRSEEAIEHIISSMISLWKGARRVDVVTELANQSEDHRLRVLFPSEAKTDTSIASGKFDVISRPVKTEPRGEYTEEPSHTHPSDGWVMARDERRGLMIATHGLLEYELKDDEERTLAITLLRSVGWLSRSDLLTRKGNAGPTAPTKDAQCLGRHTFNYSIIPAGKTQNLGKLQRLAYQHNIPLNSIQIQKGDANGTKSFISLEPEEVILTTVKKAENSNALLVRFFNSDARNTKAILKVFKRPKSVTLANLAEVPFRKIPVTKDGTIKINVKGKEIVTVRLNY